MMNMDVASREEDSQDECDEQAQGIFWPGK